MREGAVTITQILVSAVGGLGLLLSSELVRSSLKQRRRAAADMAPSFRQVGTFGGLGQFSGAASPLASTGSSGRGFFTVLLIVTFLGMGTVAKFAWDQTHPDLRSAYGRAYERCVTENKINRWKVEEVERCIHSGRSFNG
jgi:hypothetical protein